MAKREYRRRGAAFNAGFRCKCSTWNKTGSAMANVPRGTIELTSCKYGLYWFDTGLWKVCGNERIVSDGKFLKITVPDHYSGKDHQKFPLWHKNWLISSPGGPLLDTWFGLWKLCGNHFRDSARVGSCKAINQRGSPPELPGFLTLGRQQTPRKPNFLTNFALA